MKPNFCIKPESLFSLTAPAALKSTSPAAKNQTDNEIPHDVVQHKNLPKIAVVVLLAMAVGIFIAVWHAHFMRKR